jgi:hypothetical protein
MRELIKHILREHVKTVNEVRFIWTKEMLRDVAYKYTTLYDLIKNDLRAYYAMRDKGWFDELTQHLDKSRPKKWTKNNVHNIAKKYQRRIDFYNGDNNAYQAALRHGWLDDVSTHMITEFRWTKEMVHDEAKKYNRRVEFRNKSPKAYDAALRNGWIDEVCSHMEVVGNLLKRMVYAWEFDDNSVYIGLTSDKQRREHQHFTKTNSAVNKHIIQTGLKPRFVELSVSYIDAKDAKILEGNMVDQYKCNGWTILNQAKAGSLGGGKCSRVWTEEKVREEILKYKTLNEFRTKSKLAYNAVKSNKWYHLLEPLERTVKPNLDFNQVQQEAQKYTTIRDFAEKSNSEYQWAKRNKVMDIVTAHMTPLLIKWTPDKIDNELQKYQTYDEFKKNSRKAYDILRYRKQLDYAIKYYENLIK